MPSHILIDAWSFQKKSHHKLISSARVSSPPEPLSPSNVDSLDAYSDHGLDDVSRDSLHRLSHLMCDESRSVSPHVLSCGEDALMSPDTLDGGASRMGRSRPGRVTGPTDFSHLRQEFQKRGINAGNNLRLDDVDENSGDGDDGVVGNDNDSVNSDQTSIPEEGDDGDISELNENLKDDSDSSCDDSIGSGIDSIDSDIDDNNAAIDDDVDDDIDDVEDDSDDDSDDVLADILAGDDTNDAASVNDDAASVEDDAASVEDDAASVER